MPRLSTSDYLKNRRLLYEIWHSHGGHGFQLISPRDQRYLHDYFRPSEELTSSNALKHRRQITQERPSLPACAGRALKHLANPEPQVSDEDRPGKHRLLVYPLVRPKIDTEKLAKALFDLARRELEGGVTPAPMDDEARRQHLSELAERSRRHIRTSQLDADSSSPPRRAA